MGGMRCLEDGGGGGLVSSLTSASILESSCRQYFLVSFACLVDILLGVNAAGAVDARCLSASRIVRPSAMSASVKGPCGALAPEVKVPLCPERFSRRITSNDGAGGITKRLLLVFKLPPSPPLAVETLRADTTE